MISSWSGRHTGNLVTTEMFLHELEEYAGMNLDTEFRRLSMAMMVGG